MSIRHSNHIFITWHNYYDYSAAANSHTQVNMHTRYIEDTTYTNAGEFQTASTINYAAAVTNKAIT